MDKNAPIKVEVAINTSVENAWKCFTNSDDVVKWNFASPDWHCPKATNDLKVGSSFNYRMEAKDGSFGFDFEGKYTEIEPLKKIAYIMADGRNVSISFTEIGTSNCKVEELFDPETQNPPDLQRAGWQAILDNYKKICEQ